MFFCFSRHTFFSIRTLGFFQNIWFSDNFVSEDFEIFVKICCCINKKILIAFSPYSYLLWLYFSFKYYASRAIFALAGKKFYCWQYPLIQVNQLFPFQFCTKLQGKDSSTFMFTSVLMVFIFIKFVYWLFRAFLSVLPNSLKIFQSFCNCTLSCP